MTFIDLLTILLLALLLGSVAYSVLTIMAARNYRRVPSPLLSETHAISILRPLHGADEDTEENLRSCFAQEYPRFEILAAVHQPDDPAVAIFERMRAEFPHGPNARLLVVGERSIPNAKAYSLHYLLREAKHDVLVMSDSDVRMAPGALRTLAAEFRDASVGVVTCPYRGIAGQSLWSRLEAIGMNSEFLGGVLVARMLEGMKFALGPTIAARREVVERVGGFWQLGEFLAEDFVLGQRTVQQGYRVLLSSCVIEHRIGSQSFGENMRHRLRWARSTRRSRPAGYWGQIFINPLPLALLLCAADRKAWPVVALTILFRAFVAAKVADRVLSPAIPAADWLLLPIEDLLSFLVWVTAFFGNGIQWGGQDLRLRADGRLELAAVRKPSLAVKARAFTDPV